MQNAISEYIHNINIEDLHFTHQSNKQSIVLKI